MILKKIISISLASLLIFTSCSNNQEQNTEQSSDDAIIAQTVSDNITLNTVSMFGEGDSAGECYQEIIDQFEKENNITVNDQSSTSDQKWKTDVIAEFQVGNSPDVLFYFTGVDAEPIIQSGKVIDVDTIRLEYPEYGEDITDSAMSFMIEPDGKSYALPIRGFWEGLFINEDLFLEYNLELPTTWENLVLAMETFATTDIVPAAFSFADVPHYGIEHLILSVGGATEHSAILDAENGISESWITGLNLLAELNQIGAFPENATEISNVEVQQMFINKETAMILEGSWFLDSIVDQENTTVIPFPSYTTNQKDPTDIIGGYSSGFYITKKAWEDPEKRDLAVKFVMSMTSKEAISKFAKVSGAPAADIESPKGLTELQTDGINLMLNAHEILMPIDSRLNKDAWDYIIFNVSDISEGTTDAKEVLEGALELIE